MWAPESTAMYASYAIVSAQTQKRVVHASRIEELRHTVVLVPLLQEEDYFRAISGSTRLFISRKLVCKQLHSEVGLALISYLMNNPSVTQHSGDCSLNHSNFLRLAACSSLPIVTAAHESSLRAQSNKSSGSSIVFNS